MSDSARRQLRVLLLRGLLGVTFLAGTALTWSAARVGFAAAFRSTCGYPRVQTAKLRVKAAMDATAQYMMDNSNNCPRGIDELVAQKYLDPNNVKDPWGKALSFRCPGTCDGSCADVWSAGPDGEERTADDIKSWEL